MIYSGKNEKEIIVTFHRSFFPKIRIKISLNWQVFWLASLFAAFPSRLAWTVAEIAKNYEKAYSCGYSSGFAPDSLLFHLGLLPNRNQFAGKCMVKIVLL